MQLQVVRRDGGVRPLVLDDGEVVLAGFAGRDVEAVRRHVEELRREGVPPPATTPEFYRVPFTLLTLPADDLEVPHEETSGEAEPVLIRVGDELYVTVGSDHTDRRRERLSIAEAKRFGPKVLAPACWPYEEVAGHWDELRLEAWVADGRPYQQGTLAELLPPSAFPLVSTAGDGGPLVLFLGTLPTIGGLAFAPRFAAALSDPILGRRLTLAYAVRPRARL